MDYKDVARATTLFHDIKPEPNAWKDPLHGEADWMNQTSILVQKTDSRANDLGVVYPGDVGYDLQVLYPDLPIGEEGPVILPFSFMTLPTGLKVKVGNNTWGCIRPRSSTFIKRNLFVMEGTIDCGYTGDLFIIAYNPTGTGKTIKNGDCIAQLIPIPRFLRVDVINVPKMPETVRGRNGFGSSGGNGASGK